MYIRRPSKPCFRTAVPLLAGLFAAHLASAAVAPWIGNPGVTATTNWSDTANWTGGVGASANDVKFGGTGSTGDATTITSVVDSDQNPLSLQYSNNLGQFHMTFIPAGKTVADMIY